MARSAEQSDRASADPDRQGRVPAGPPRRQDSRRALRPRRRSTAPGVARPRLRRGAAPLRHQRGADPRHRRQGAVRADQGARRSTRSGAASRTPTCWSSVAARRSPSRSTSRSRGEAASGTLVTQETNTIEIEADAMSIPQSLTVSLEGAAAGTQFTAGQIAAAGRRHADRRSRSAGRQRGERADRRGPRERGRRRGGRGRRAGRGGRRGRGRRRGAEAESESE